MLKIKILSLAFLVCLSYANDKNMTQREKTLHIRQMRDQAILMTTKLNAKQLISTLLLSIRDNNNYILNSAEQEITMRLKNEDDTMLKEIKRHISNTTGQNKKYLSRILESSKPRPWWKIGWL